MKDIEILKNNNEFWALRGHKYLEQLSKDNDLKFKNRQYNNKYTVKDLNIYIKIIISNLY